MSNSAANEWWAITGVAARSSVTPPIARASATCMKYRLGRRGITTHDTPGAESLRQIRERRLETSAVGHRPAVKRVPDRVALLQPILPRHRAVRHLDVVADRGAGIPGVRHQRVPKAAKRRAGGLQID